MLIQMARGSVSVVTLKLSLTDAYNLILKRNNPKVEHLHSRPKHEICFQGWQVDFLELAGHRSTSTAFSHSHKSEEACEPYSRGQQPHLPTNGERPTEWSENELIESHSLQCRNGSALLGDGKCSREECEPVKLDR